METFLCLVLKIGLEYRGPLRRLSPDFVLTEGRKAFLRSYIRQDDDAEYRTIEVVFKLMHDVCLLL